MKNRINRTLLILSAIFVLISLFASCSGTATPDTPVTFYTVTFDSDGGSSVESQSVESGKKATKPAAPTKSGYEFDGWYIDDIQYDFSNEVTANITLKAKWSIIYYIVMFDSNGGSIVPYQTVEANKTVSKPENPTYYGYNFIDWYIGDTVYDFSSPVTSDITLTAKWVDMNEIITWEKEVTNENIVRTILTLTTSRTLKATGEFTDELIQQIKDALKQLYEKDYTIQVCLDLSETTGSDCYGDFYGCNNIAGVKLPDYFTSINFYNCYLLTNITIPKGVTNISGAFSHCTNLTSISIPDTITTIGYSAFSDCSSLSSITIPDSVTKIESSAFSNCSGLTSITIPDSVTEIGDAAFSGCSKLTSVTIPEKVTSIGDYAFKGCSNLTSITIPDNVTSLGSKILYDCKQLKEITIPFIGSSVDSEPYTYTNSSGKEEYYTEQFLGYFFNDSKNYKYNNEDYVYTKQQDGDGHSVTYYIPKTLEKVTVTGGKILPGAFSDCQDIRSITLPENIKEIPKYAFYDCKNLESVNIPDGVTSIGTYAFSECNYLTNIVIPETVTDIETYAFNRCVTLEDITIPGSVTLIKDHTFFYCTKLAKITISDGVTGIGNYAFGNCFNLSSITISDSITSIGDYAFTYCNNLNTITIPDSVTSIGDYAFSSCNKLNSITISNNITSIGKNILSGCNSLAEITTPCLETDSPEKNLLGYYFSESSISTSTTITQVDTNLNYHHFNIPSSLKKITISGDKLLKKYLYNCKSLQEITIPDNISKIDEYTFCNISDLKIVKLPDCVTSIGQYAFYKCSSLPSINIPDGVTSIGSYAFYECSSLTSINIPEKVTSIGDYAFSGCTSLTSVKTLNNAISTGDYTFYECPGLTSISVSSIGKYTFYGCTNLTSITILDSVTKIGDYAFYGCTSLTSITIPDHVTVIGEYAFYNDTGLTNIIIPNSVDTIYSRAFCGCTGLKSITIPDTINYLGSYILARCYSLEEITIPCISANSDGKKLFGYYFEKAPGANYTSDFITTINQGALDGSYFQIPNSLKKITIVGGNIPQDYFTGLSIPISIVITEGLTSIKYSAFSNCTGLISITIPDTVTSIGTSVFRGCSGLTSITIPEKVTNIGTYAFMDCSNLVNVIFENTENWKMKISLDPNVDVSDPTQAATLLTQNYSYEFYRSDE